VSFLGRSGVSKHKWPEHFVTCDELPRTDTGKLARGRAAEIARERVGLTSSTTDTGD
jgi:acyl-coenzyme A synthetase/AMP-(fatty) acid ligase